MIETPKYSKKGRSAQDVARAVVGLPFKCDDTVIGEIVQSWVDGFDVKIRVSFNRKIANEVKQLNMPLSEQELPEERIYDLKVESWDRIFDASLRFNVLKGVKQ